MDTQDKKAVGAYLDEKIKKASATWKGVDVDKYMNEVRGREPTMTAQEIIEKIRAEVNRLCNKHITEDIWDRGYNYACEEIMSILSDLEKSEKPSGGEEEEYEQIKQKVCSDCPSHKDDYCGYVTRQLQRKCNYLSDVMYGYELGRQSKAFYAEELDEEIIRYKVPFVNEKENLDERTLNAIAYHFATWMESKLLHECESAYNNGYVAGQQSKPEVSEDVEEAAKAYADDINSNECLYTYTDFTDAFKAGAKWQKEQDDKELSEKIASAYQLGLADKEKMMMKEAVEVVVTETCGIASVWIKTKQFKPGQKIPVIIVKEDEK